MSVKKPSHEEDEFFAKEEAAKRHALAVEKARQIADEERTRLRELHYMKCPKCGFDLEQVKYKGVNIDRCFHCNGTWLDAGELEMLAGHDEKQTILDQIIGVFKRDRE